MGTLEIVIGALVVLANNGLWVFIFRMAFNRIKSVEEKMLTKDECGYKHGEVVKELDKSDDKFEQINGNITKILVEVKGITTKVDDLRSV